MSYLGNILTKEKVEENELFNIVSEDSMLISGIPTLIIGWERAKEMFPSASIIDWEIDNLFFWTFGKRVRRDRFEKDLKNFKEYVINKTISDVKYRFFNVLTESKTEKMALNTIITDHDEKYCLISGDMVYIFIPNQMECIGISLEQIDYEGGNRKAILKKVLQNDSIKKVKEKDFISSDTRELIRDRRYIIPYLAYIRDC